MKNLLKTLGIIALAAIIGFGFVSCDNGTTGKNSGVRSVSGDDNPLALKLSNVPVTIEDTPSSYNFGYLYKSGAKPISDFITGMSKAQIAGSRLTLELDALKPEKLSLLSNDFTNVTITPNTAKYYMLDWFCTANANFDLEIHGPNGGKTYLVYVDKNVTINGAEDEYFHFANVSLKKGWNFISFDVSPLSHITVSLTHPGDTAWKVIKN